MAVAGGPAGTGATDEDLLRAHVAGDPDAFGVLFARHRDRLWAVALRTTGNPEDAADALQDALVAAFRRAGTFSYTAQVTTWLHRVVVNACLDRFRAERVRSHAALPDDPDRHVADVVGARPPEDPADAAVARDRRARVLAALATLSPEQRAAVVLVDMEGFSVAEAAAILECPAGTVKSRCSRARGRLAELLLPSDDPDPAYPGNPEPPRAVPSPDPARGPPEA